MPAPWTRARADAEMDRGERAWRGAVASARALLSIPRATGFRVGGVANAPAIILGRAEAKEAARAGSESPGSGR